ncbi:hypothetical protein ENBRE01_1928 [Enteropsectra breve]|nr:hypothetical protein ENBRE01_1928 [Enteropsectra breve]
MVQQSIAVLLKNMLKNPDVGAMIINQVLLTEDGFNDFMENITANNPLAYIFLKQYSLPWLCENTHEVYYSPRILDFLVKNVSRSNEGYLAEYFHILSINRMLSFSFIKGLVSNRKWQLLEGVVKKYLICPRSAELFSEINAVIEIMIPSLKDAYFSPERIAFVEGHFLQLKDKLLNESSSILEPPANDNSAFFDIHLINIIHYLLFQDIHPFFEDNSVYFLKVFATLFSLESHRETLLKIYELYSTKYQDCADYVSIIISLGRMEEMDATAMKIITSCYANLKKSTSYESEIYTTEDAEKTTRLLIKMLKNTLILDIGEIEDILTYTKDILQGNDVKRGASHQLIKLINPAISTFQGEPSLFVATVLRSADPFFVDGCRTVISQPSADETLAFSAFHYLISVKKYFSCDISYFQEESSCRFIAMKYLSLFYKSTDRYHMNRLNMNHLNMNHLSCVLNMQSNSSLYSADDSDLMINRDSIFVFLISELETKHINEFNSELLFRMVKAYPELLNSKLMDVLSGAMLHVESIGHTSLVWLFDAFLLVSLKFKKFSLDFVQKIISNELVDSYAYGFYYLAVLLTYSSGAVDPSLVVNILSTEAFWAERELQMAMVVLLIAAHKGGLVGEGHVRGVHSLLQEEREDGKACRFSDYLCLVLISRCGLQIDASDDPVKRLMADGAFDRQWFLENCMEKRYARLVIKQMLRINAGDVVNQVIEKNINGIEYEAAPHGIIVAFDL